jgi:hypothetical protein
VWLVDREHHRERGAGGDQRQRQRRGDTESAPPTLTSLRRNRVGFVALRPGVDRRGWGRLDAVTEALVEKFVDPTTG